MVSIYSVSEMNLYQSNANESFLLTTLKVSTFALFARRSDTISVHPNSQAISSAVNWSCIWNNLMFSVITITKITNNIHSHCRSHSHSLSLPGGETQNLQVHDKRLYAMVWSSPTRIYNAINWKESKTRQFTSSCASRFIFWAIRKETVWVCPLLTAWCNGVHWDCYDNAWLGLINNKLKTHVARFFVFPTKKPIEEKIYHNYTHKIAFTISCASISAPWAISSEAISVWPLLAAACKGVDWFCEGQ